QPSRPGKPGRPGGWLSPGGGESPGGWDGGGSATKTVTVSPGATVASGPGCWSNTRPGETCLSGGGCPFSTLHFRPRLSSLPHAARWLLLNRSGTFRLLGPFETVTVTVEPFGAFEPPGGSVAITLSRGTLSLLSTRFST